MITVDEGRTEKKEERRGSRRSGSLVFHSY